MTVGRLATHASHEERLSAQRDVTRFVMDVAPGNQECTLAAAALWAFALPKLFTNRLPETDLVKFFESLSRRCEQSFSKLVTAVDFDGRDVDLQVDNSRGVWDYVLPFYVEGVPNAERYRIRVSHSGGSLGYTTIDMNRNHVYAHGMILRLLPRYSADHRKVVDSAAAARRENVECTRGGGGRCGSKRVSTRRDVACSTRSTRTFR